MESKAKTIKQCDNCSGDLSDKEKKGQSIKAVLEHPSDSKKNVSMTFCSEKCLRKKLISRAARKRSKASVIGKTLEIEIITEKKY